MTDGDKDRIDVAGRSVTPLTTTITVRWRPTPRVYDARLSLLTAFEDQKRLRAFSVDGDMVHALVADDAELAMTPQSISIAFSSGVPEGAVLVPILDQTLEMLKPRITRYYGRFQHLIGLESFSSYDRARSAVASKLFGALSKDLSLTDSAVLIDGSL